MALLARDFGPGDGARFGVAATVNDRAVFFDDGDGFAALLLFHLLLEVLRHHVGHRVQVVLDEVEGLFTVAHGFG